MHPVAVVLERIRIVEDYAVDQPLDRRKPPCVSDIDRHSAQHRWFARRCRMDLDGPGLAGERNACVEQRRS